MKEQWIALLGLCDRPTDAVEDYCKFLRDALSELGVELFLERMAWDADGWPTADAELRRRAAQWRGQRVLTQYTALAWSARGFPRRFPGIVKGLRAAGARVAVVYHDVEPYEGQRVIDCLRRAAQVRTMRSAMAAADAAILTVPPEKLSWMTADLARKAVFVPVGANLPVSATPSREAAGSDGRTVAVFGVTGGEAGLREVREIAEALRFAVGRVAKLRLVVLGRETETMRNAFQEALNGTGVAVTVLGVLPGEQVVQTLRAADVQLFVRSPISSRRGSAIAGIACGLPVIARAGSETAAPVTEAGVAFYSPGGDEPGATLARVLSDDSYRATLAVKSRRAYQEHFSWSAIARKYVAALK